MERKKRSTGPMAIAVALALFLTLMTLSTVYILWNKIWWFPPAINALGKEIDAQYFRTFIITGIVFVLSQLALGWVVVRYRARGGRSHYSHGNVAMEAAWTLATAVMFLGLGIYAQRSWAAFHFRGAAPGAVQVEVTGQQFAWNFRYPGPDGKFGRTDPKLVNDAGGNPLGLDEKDSAAKDDLVVPTIAVPVNREVELILRSKDVTHSFFLRELRLKQDTVPGMIIRVHFTANQVGRYEVACAELCGLGHHRMRTFLQVLPEAEYEQWLKSQAAAE